MFVGQPWIEPPVDDTLEIVAESKHLVIVNKRKEYPVVPHGDFLQNSLLNIVRRKFPEAAPLHRLGRGTTGAIVFAKTSEGAKQNCRLFESRQVKKVYRCVVSGVPPWDVLEAECFIGPVPWPGTNGGVFAAVPNEEAHKNKQNKRSLTTFTGHSFKEGCRFGSLFILSFGSCEAWRWLGSFRRKYFHRSTPSDSNYDRICRLSVVGRSFVRS